MFKDKLDNVREILICAAPKGKADEYSIDGADKTSLKEVTSLDDAQLESYLDFLSKEKLVEEGHEKILTTRKGLGYLTGYEKINKL